jgi:hypothetical protein
MYDLVEMNFISIRVCRVANPVRTSPAAIRLMRDSWSLFMGRGLDGSGEGEIWLLAMLASTKSNTNRTYIQSGVIKLYASSHVTMTSNLKQKFRIRGIEPRATANTFRMRGGNVNHYTISDIFPTSGVFTCH